MPPDHVTPMSAPVDSGGLATRDHSVDDPELRVIRCAVIGYGYWGKILSARLYADPLFELTMICDRSRACGDHPDLPERVQFTTDLDVALGASSVEAVFIATPPATHHEVAERALMGGKHVWLEKPCCASSGELESLITLASRLKLTLYLDLIMTFNPLIESMRTRIEALKEREVSQGASRQRHELKMYRENADHIGARLGGSLDIIYDLGVHDLSVIKRLYPELNVSDLTLEVRSEGVIDHAPYPRTLLKLNAPQVEVEVWLSWLALHKRREVEWRGVGEAISFRLERSEREEVHPRVERARVAERAQMTLREALYERSLELHEAPHAERCVTPQHTQDAISSALSGFAVMVHLNRASHDSPLEDASALSLLRGPSEVELWDIARFTHRVIERLHVDSAPRPKIT